MSAVQDIADLRISTVDDNIVELNESLIVQIGRITSNRPVKIVEPNSTTILIIDNDGKHCSYLCKIILLQFIFYHPISIESRYSLNYYAVTCQEYKHDNATF